MKNGIHVIEKHTNNMQTKFQSNIFGFGCVMTQKLGKGDDVTCLKCNFWHFYLSYITINGTFGILGQNCTR